MTSAQQLLVSLGHLLIGLLPILEYFSRTNVCFVILAVLFLEALRRIGSVSTRTSLYSTRLRKRTLCSITSFLETFSKYPSHIFLNRSRISFSTSSSSSFDVVGNAPLASFVVSSDKFPGSAEAETCLEVACGGTIPRNGRE